VDHGQYGGWGWGWFVDTYHLHCLVQRNVHTGVCRSLWTSCHQFRTSPVRQLTEPVATVATRNPTVRTRNSLQMSKFTHCNNSSSRYTATYGHTLNDKSCSKGFRYGFPVCVTDVSFSRQKVALEVTVTRNRSLVWIAEATLRSGRFHNNEEVEILLREWFKMQVKFLPQRNI
jgi:hypothetical protein